jgi:hypothetical protein
MNRLHWLLIGACAMNAPDLLGLFWWFGEKYFSREIAEKKLPQNFFNTRQSHDYAHLRSTNQRNGEARFAGGFACAGGILS